MKPLHFLVFAPLALLSSTASLLSTEPPPKEELEAAAHDFARTYDGSAGNGYENKVKDLASEVAKAAGCDAAATKALAEASAPVAGREREAWYVVYHHYYLSHYDRMSDGSLWDDYPDMLAGDLCRKELGEATAQWNALLAAHLTPEQQQRWQAELKARLLRREKAAIACVADTLIKKQKAAQKEFESRSDWLSRTVEMSAERKAVLAPVVQSAVDSFLKTWRAAAEKGLRLWNEDFLRFRLQSIESLEHGTDKNQFAGWVRLSTQGFNEAAGQVLLPEEQKRLAAKVAAAHDQLAAAATKLSLLKTRHSTTEREWEERCERVVNATGMNEARQAELKTRLTEAALRADESSRQAFIASCVQRMQKTFDGLADPGSFLDRVDRGEYSYYDERLETSAQAARDKAWQEVTDGLLTTAEQEQMRHAEARGLERQSRVFALTVMMELDDRLLLTEAQHEALQPLAVQAAKDYPLGPAELSSLWQQQTAGSLVLVHAMGLEKVEAVLEGSQKGAFRELAERYRYNWGKLRRKKHSKA